MAAVFPEATQEDIMEDGHSPSAISTLGILRTRRLRQTRVWIGTLGKMPSRIMNRTSSTLARVRGWLRWKRNHVLPAAEDADKNSNLVRYCKIWTTHTLSTSRTCAVSQHGYLNICITNDIYTSRASRRGVDHDTKHVLQPESFRQACTIPNHRTSLRRLRVQK